MPQLAFDQEFLRKLDHIALTTRTAVKGEAGGNRKSRSKGSSVEFSDFREYARGDDFRRIDWNAYGRFERLFVKLFMEEREAVVSIFIDCSKSMDWGQPNKGVLAKQLAAVLAYLSLANFDQVAVIACNDTLWSNLPTLSGRGSFWRVLQYLEGLPFEGQTALSHSIRSYLSLGGRGGISVVISDLFSKDDYREGLKYLQYKRQEVVLLHLLAPQELEPELEGSIRLLDREGEEPREIQVTPMVLKGYKRVLEEFIREQKEFCHNRGIHYIPVSSGLSLDQVVFGSLFRLGIIR